jgi:hypothetical protein
MRKALIPTAAVLAAVIFFLLGTLPPRPRAVLWGGDPDLARRTIAGAYHIHTTRSDGAGDRTAVAAAAARAGLKLVIITDHGDGTRTPDPPAYLDGVLCIDGVEVSTHGGHYVALGMGATPYPLGGEPAAVVEDVARLGGFGIAAHPDSPRPELAWTDWSAGIDGVEWLSGDTAWRGERRSRLARVLFDYTLRPGPALASILHRPTASLARWDALTSHRQVVALGGHDAHGGIVGTNQEGQRFSIAGVPSYAASFRSFSTRVILSASLSGDAQTDARAVLDSIRKGRVFTAIDAIAGPAVLDFRASRGGESSSMGSALAPGPAVLSVNAAVPSGARTVLFRDGREIHAENGGTLRLDEALAQGAYRVEVQVPGAPGTPPVPWLSSNPIYFLPPPRATPAHPTDAGQPLPAGVSWHVEKDPASIGAATVSAARVAFQYQLGAGRRASQFVALVADLRGRSNVFRTIVFTGSSARPTRVSVQLRYPNGGGERWGHSVYLDPTPREVRVDLDDMLPADRHTESAPVSSAATGLLFVVDLTNALPGEANRISIERVGLGS